MFSKVLLCLVLASVAYADDFNLEEQDVYGEARLLDSVFNNTEININSILALILVGILALITLGPNFLGGGAYNRNTYSYDYQDYQDYYNHGFQKRTSPVFEGSGKPFLERNYLLFLPRNLLGCHRNILYSQLTQLVVATSLGTILHR